MTNQFTDKLDTIHKRLLADVDDRMEFVGTIFNPKSHAANKVSEALEEASQQILAAIAEEIKNTQGYYDKTLDELLISEEDLRQALGISPEKGKG